MKMRKLVLPRVNFEVFFYTCIENKKEPHRTRLIECFPLISSLSNHYSELAKSSDFYRLERVDTSILNDLTKEECADLYSERMVAKDSPGRRLFDRLISAAKGKCPFCQHKEPRTLDHYLPKSIRDGYPELSINPMNLVPCCRDCNSDKGTHIPRTKSEQFIHPYFDDIQNVQWLNALIEYNEFSQPTVNFFVNENINVAVLRNRINYQFQELNLSRLYSIEAGNEVSGIAHYLRKLKAKGTISDVRDYLKEIYVSWKRENINSWQTVLYKCLSADDRFCSLNWYL